MVTRSTLPLFVCALIYALSGYTTPAFAAQASSSLDAALPAHATGEQIFVAACATCHGMDGKGSPSAVVGFDLPLPNGHDFPDFTDCATNTVEPLGDWGPARILMGALTSLAKRPIISAEWRKR